jgi:hypothetical protein
MTSKWVNVLDFGADPTGTVDSLAAFTAAIAAVAATGSGGAPHQAGYATGEPSAPFGVYSVPTLYIPAGSYIFSGPFTISSYMSVVGDNCFLIPKDYNTDCMLIDQTNRKNIYGIKFLVGKNQIKVLAHMDNFSIRRCSFIHPGYCGLNNSEWFGAPVTTDSPGNPPATAKFNATFNGTNLTVTSMISGTIQVPGVGLNGMSVYAAWDPYDYAASQAGVTNFNFVSQTSGTPGGAGVYVINASQPVVGPFHIQASVPAVGTHELWMDECEFLGQYGDTSGSMMNCFGSDVTYLNNCRIHTSKAIPFILNHGEFRITNSFFVQSGGVQSWFKVTDGFLSINNCKITGETGAGAMFEYHSSTGGDGAYAMGPGVGGIQIVDSTVVSALLKFYNLPTYPVKIKGTTGSYYGFWFDTGINNLQLQSADLASWDIDWAYSSAIPPLAAPAVVGNNLALATSVFHRVPHKSDKHSYPLSTDFLGYVRPGGYPQDATVITAAQGGGGGAAGYTSVYATDSRSGTFLIKNTSTTDAYVATSFYGTSIPLSIGKGQYTLSLPIEIETDHTLMFGMSYGAVKQFYTISKGRHVLNLPFTVDFDVIPGVPGTTVAVGDMVGFNSNVTNNNFVTVNMVTTAGTIGDWDTKSWFGPALTGSFDFPFQWTDGHTAQLVSVDAHTLGLNCYRIPSGCKFNWGDFRIFRGYYDREEWEVISQGTSIPVKGVWHVGDKVVNTLPTSGGPSGWVCTTSGILAPAWTQNTAYSVGDFVSANSVIWSCIKAGTSLGSGTGPTNSTQIWPTANYQQHPYFNDNGVYWVYIAATGTPAVFSPYGLIG